MASTYADTGQVLNTGGVDAASGNRPGIPAGKRIHAMGVGWLAALHNRRFPGHADVRHGLEHRPWQQPPPPAGPLPSYPAVIVASHVTQAPGSTITGDSKHVIIARTNPGYQPGPGRPRNRNRRAAHEVIRGPAVVLAVVADRDRCPKADHRAQS